MTVFTKMYNTAGKSVGIYAQSKTQQDMQLAMDETRVILRNRLHRMYYDDDGFSVATVDTFLTIWSNLTGSIFMVMIFVVSIALVVGGIVIMNIMLVSVTERTREIGLRKALGARQQDILGQFLAEAVMLAAIGGVIGVAAGGGVAALVAAFSPLPASVTLWSVFVAIFVSSAIGIVAGVYPARQAARLDPVVALRQE
jgi:putative ABC transport system permease protein